MTDTDSDSANRTDGTTTGELEIEDGILARAERAYPACATRRELFRRVFEKGVCARECELREDDGGGDQTRPESCH